MYQYSHNRNRTYTAHTYSSAVLTEHQQRIHIPVLSACSLFSLHCFFSALLFSAFVRLVNIVSERRNNRVRSWFDNLFKLTTAKIRGNVRISSYPETHILQTHEHRTKHTHIHWHLALIYGPFLLIIRFCEKEVAQIVSLKQYQKYRL